MQTITLDEVITAGRKAYEAKTLTAQSASPQCVYEDKTTGCKCVVGSAMTDETLAAIHARGVISTAIGALAGALGGGCGTGNIVDAPSPQELNGIQHLQSAHDNWCQSVVLDEGGDMRAEEEFVRLLYSENA